MVIAIIAILAAILFPVFARAQEKAQQASCANNLRQLTMAMPMYSEDYAEALPPTLTGDLNGPVWSVYELLDPYMKNKQITTCPTDQGDVDLTSIGLGKYSYTTNEGGWSVSGYYAWPVMQAYLPFLYTPWPNMLPRVRMPAATVAFFDGDLDEAELATPSIVVRPDNRHNQMTNYSFLDGHVKALKEVPPGHDEHGQGCPI